MKTTSIPFHCSYSSLSLSLSLIVIPRGKRAHDEFEIHSFDTKPLIFHHSSANFSSLHFRFYSPPRHGSGADLHSRSGEVFADAHAQSQSCSGVSLPIYCHNLVLYSRCYARQLRSAGICSISASSPLLGLSIICLFCRCI